MARSSEQETITTALEEMDYKTGVGSFGQDMSVSIPAQFRFTETLKENTRRFHVELKRRGYSPLDSEPDRKAGDRPHYEGEICSREHYDRMKVLVFRGGVVRLYPHDGWDVTEEELRDVLDALEAGRSDSRGGCCYRHPQRSTDRPRGSARPPYRGSFEVTWFDRRVRVTLHALFRGHVLARPLVNARGGVDRHATTPVAASVPGPMLYVPIPSHTLHLYDSSHTPVS